MASKEILQLNQKLLDAIVSGDWKVYVELCDEELTCFEPEAGNNQVSGLKFHQFFFPNEPVKNPSWAHMISPVVKLIGDTGACVSYTRLMQVDPLNPVMTSYQETRIWQLKNGKWKHIHFHKSKL